MKEIQKVVQKLSREQESAAGGGGGAGAGGGVRTGTKHKVTPVYWGDLINKWIHNIFGDCPGLNHAETSEAWITKTNPYHIIW